MLNCARMKCRPTPYVRVPVPVRTRGTVPYLSDTATCRTTQIARMRWWSARSSGRSSRRRQWRRPLVHNKDCCRLLWSESPISGAAALQNALLVPSSWDVCRASADVRWPRAASPFRSVSLAHRRHHRHHVRRLLRVSPHAARRAAPRGRSIFMSHA